MAEVIARVTEENSKVEGGLVELSNGETTLQGRVAAVSENEFLVDWEDGARTVESKSDYELVVEPRTAAEAPADFASTQTKFPPLPGGSDYGLDTPKSMGMGATPDGRCYTCGGARGKNHNCITRDEKGNRVPQMGQDLWSGNQMRPAASVTAAENPGQPTGFAVPPVDADAYPGGELMAIEQEKRAETAEWEDTQNREPVDGPNPAQPAGWAVPEATGAPIPGQGADGLLFAARVVADDITGEGGAVEITNGNLRVAGKILAADDETFIVEWEDERRTVESKADYDLVINASEEEEN